jgi:hypothetical protein
MRKRIVFAVALMALVFSATTSAWAFDFHGHHWQSSNHPYVVVWDGGTDWEGRSPNTLTDLFSEVGISEWQLMLRCEGSGATFRFEANGSLFRLDPNTGHWLFMDSGRWVR